MYSRVTLLEIDTLRTSMESSVARFTDEVLPELREQEGYEGVLVLTTPEGKGMVVSFWDTLEAAAAATAFAAAAVERFVTLYSAAPGREHYEVAFADLPIVA